MEAIAPMPYVKTFTYLFGGLLAGITLTLLCAVFIYGLIELISTFF